jgi:transcriptional regulator with XRE-family HTH domain
MSVGWRLRVEMALHQRRVTEVAREAGIPVATLSRILHDHQRPSVALLRRIEAAIRGEVRQ